MQGTHGWALRPMNTSCSRLCVACGLATRGSDGLATSRCSVLGPSTPFSHLRYELELREPRRQAALADHYAIEGVVVFLAVAEAAAVLTAGASAEAPSARIIVGVCWLLVYDEATAAIRVATAHRACEVPRWGCALLLQSMGRAVPTPTAVPHKKVLSPFDVTSFY